MKTGANNSDRKRITELASVGWNAKQIAAELGLTKAAVVSFLPDTELQELLTEQTSLQIDIDKALRRLSDAVEATEVERKYPTCTPYWTV